ncbi:hypothetical protein CCUG63695_03057 [Mycobacteroides franklinii]|uniref:Uncharacterized protein n=1 Tax=Mycobacteroides franklinii TaxID=948102 RepID=A0A4V3HUZ2_9MYCO|nr:hypothetical protein CCUG64054_03130 [Mycobacteroides franklinii]TDZ50213.1 hypothetical protein CCUG63697_01715 [Mycobacteroides franklinii]TDZ56634.1 hypothetical protein CCUG63696_03132 [Mycobacteroides franklinii]TDZ63575.1 hypothetical protein CCUG63695_03057 [Mycobacteroides franklinii]TDZ69972.1 hypothetical protein CCUG64056_03130 [Mycobacteroides franklinii]
MAELSPQELRVAALVEANKWATARASAGAHPGTGDVLAAARSFHGFMDGTSTQEVK